MAQAKVNVAVKALKAHMAHEKKFDIQTLSEYDKAFCVSRTRGDVWTGERLCATFGRRLNWFASDKKHGATKVCHLNDENGNAFQYIVVKRFMHNGYGFENECGNQLISEIRAWESLCNTKYGDALCPMLKYNMERSDKAGNHLSEKGKDRCVIIAQKAVFVGDAEDACDTAERMNREGGYCGETSDSRYDYLSSVSSAMHWRDAMYNPGNSGVVFDYSKNCYKSVFIDYAL